MHRKRLLHHVQDICGVSKFFDPDKYDPHSIESGTLKKYLYYSHRRLRVVQDKFSSLGYDTKIQKFSYDGFSAKNAVFQKPNVPLFPDQHDARFWIVAHHDYCAGLGAEDNASALSVMIEVASHFQSKAVSDHLVFASFDLEELGLVGSRHFAKQVGKKQKKSIQYLIDLDCLGSGADVIICKSVDEAKSNPKLVRKIYDASSSLGYEFIQEDFGFFWADHVPFAKKGVKTAQIASLDHEAYRKHRGQELLDLRLRKDGSVAHTKRDLPENIRTENLEQVCETLIRLIEAEF
jgi:hypothetical protein